MGFQIQSDKHGISCTFRQTWDFMYNQTNMRFQVQSDKHGISCTFRQIWDFMYNQTNMGFHVQSDKHGIVCTIRQTWDCMYNQTNMGFQVQSDIHGLSGTIRQTWDYRYKQTNMGFQVQSDRHGSNKSDKHGDVDKHFLFTNSKTNKSHEHGISGQPINQTFVLESDSVEHCVEVRQTWDSSEIRQSTSNIFHKTE
ncbi:unnamed protein product [Mytilus coruscus]|uniref:Uncharacterized protein n=1 Tax=Mytilus coruscus TaxID=42192 RepID=A0A6J8DMF8_MYTCO|nr:unnamed protein product [Mytilus coruscus]